MADEQSETEAPPEGSGAVVAVYFFDGDVLVPEYRALPGGNPQRAFVDLLEEGPRHEALESRFAERGGGAFERGGETATRSGEALVFGLTEAFWDAPDPLLYERTAQLVFTAASLEAGKQVVLLRNGVPASSVRADGSELDLYLERADFRDVHPWIEIAQPVAGAVVGRTIPVSFTVRFDEPVRIDVFIGTEVVRSVTTTRSRLTLRIGRSPNEQATMRFSQRGYEVEVPLRLAAR